MPGRHQGGGVLPQLRLLVAHPERLEHRVGRVEVRARRSVELLRRHRLRERGGLFLGPTVHPDHRGAHRTSGGVAHDHPVQLRPERQPLDRGRAFRHIGDEPGHRPLDRADPQVGVLLGPGRVRERQVVRLVRGRHQRAVGGVQRGVRPLAADVAADDVRAAHGMITIFRPAPERIVSNASPICSSGNRCVTTPCQVLTAPVEVVHRDAVLTVRRAVRTQDRELLVVELVHVERTDRDRASAARRSTRPSRAWRPSRARPAAPASPAQRRITRSTPMPSVRDSTLLDPVVVPRDPRVVDELPDDAHRDVEPVAAHVGHPHPARAAVARHHGLPAPDRTGTEDHHGVAELDVQLLDPVQRARERVGDGREIRRQVVGKRDQVLRRDRRDGGVVGVRARERVVSVQQVVLAQVLEALGAPTALAAREDRAQEHAVALGHAGRQVRVGTYLGERPDRLVAEHPRGRALSGRR